jgi:hypothetical protein
VLQLEILFCGSLCESNAMRAKVHRISYERHSNIKILSYNKQAERFKYAKLKDQAIKSIWWMPWHQEPKKDVISCDKLWLAANRP